MDASLLQLVESVLNRITVGAGVRDVGGLRTKDRLSSTRARVRIGRLHHKLLGLHDDSARPRSGFRSNRVRAVQHVDGMLEAARAFELPFVPGVSDAVEAFVRGNLLLRTKPRVTLGLRACRAKKRRGVCLEDQPARRINLLHRPISLDQVEHLESRVEVLGLEVHSHALVGLGDEGLAGSIVFDGGRESISLGQHSITMALSRSNRRLFAVKVRGVLESLAPESRLLRGREGVELVQRRLRLLSPQLARLSSPLSLNLANDPGDGLTSLPDRAVLGTSSLQLTLGGLNFASGHARISTTNAALRNVDSHHGLS